MGGRWWYIQHAAPNVGWELWLASKAFLVQPIKLLIALKIKHKDICSIMNAHWFAQRSRLTKHLQVSGSSGGLLRKYGPIDFIAGLCVYGLVVLRQSKCLAGDGA